VRPCVWEHERRLQHIRGALLTPAPRHLHAWPFQRELETERAVYLMRQYAFSTLYDRVFMRPFLTNLEAQPYTVHSYTTTSCITLTASCFVPEPPTSKVPETCLENAQVKVPCHGTAGSHTHTLVHLFA